MWGARDPGNILAYKKPMRLASDVNLTPLIRTCNRQRLHQVVEGSVCCAVALAKARGEAQFSGEYPMELCKEWVKPLHST